MANPFRGFVDYNRPDINKRYLHPNKSLFLFVDFDIMMNHHGEMVVVYSFNKRPIEILK